MDLNITSYLHCYKSIEKVDEKLHHLNKKYFQNVFEIIPHEDVLIIEVINNHHSMKIFTNTTYEFFTWAKLIILNYFGVKCHGTIENGDHHPTHPDDLLIKDFNAYLDNVPIYGPEEFRTNLIENTIPRKLRKLFSIFIPKDKTRE